MGTISDGISIGDHAVMIKVSLQGVNCERCTLCLGEVLFVVSSEMFVHGGNIIDARPFCVWVFGISVVNGHFEVVHITFTWGRNIAREALKHCAFCLGLDDSFDDCCWKFVGGTNI